MIKCCLHKGSEIAPDSYLEAPRDPYVAAAYPGGDYPAPHPEYPSHPLPYQEQWSQVSNWPRSYHQQSVTRGFGCHWVTLSNDYQESGGAKTTHNCWKWTEICFLFPSFSLTWPFPGTPNFSKFNFFSQRANRCQQTDKPQHALMYFSFE